ncbi:MAG TPA: SDR family NAD(P)-dependent oxidoreductase [Steroidobacteraceae bacterium]|nr:SDR family NAD(P)-dependent oxidoreductase [Steroidobacteraceae bacterium]
MTGRPVALITGASAGLGAEFARAFAARGADLILTARREERLAALAQQLRDQHGNHTEILVADLATDAGVAAVKTRMDAIPNLHWLVNNAGFGVPGRFHSVAIDDLDRMHRLHVLAPLQLTHAALRGMVARDAGAIINVASVAGFLLASGSAGYSATKRWLHVLSEAIYLELRSTRSKVRIQSLCPGYTITEFHDVIGMQRARIPKFLWLDAHFVVRESLKALERNDLLVIPSWKYQLAVAVAKLLPRRVRYAAAVRAGRRMGRD